MKNRYYSKTIKKIQKMQSAQPRYQMLGRSGTGKTKGVQPKFFEDIFTGLEYTSEQIEQIKNCIDAPIDRKYRNRDVFLYSVKLTPEEYTEKIIKRAKDSIISVDLYKIKYEKN